MNHIEYIRHFLAPFAFLSCPVPNAAGRTRYLRTIAIVAIVSASEINDTPIVPWPIVFIHSETELIPLAISAYISAIFLHCFLSYTPPR